MTDAESLSWTALLEAGRNAEAARVIAAHRADVAAAMAYIEEQAAYVGSATTAKRRRGSRSGFTSKGGLVWIRWDHSTSRAQQPQLHSHVTVLNRAETDSDGVVRALASPGFSADAIYTKALNETLAASNGVVFATRPDGKAREIAGFSATGRDHAEQNTHAYDVERLYRRRSSTLSLGRAVSSTTHRQPSKPSDLTRSATF